jgi:hypothetical protein
MSDLQSAKWAKADMKPKSPHDRRLLTQSGSRIIRVAVRMSTRRGHAQSLASFGGQSLSVGAGTAGLIGR